jgi:hypothetical protein
MLTLVRAQVRRPWLFVLACIALAAASGALALRLELKTRFEQLLPESRPSVVELKRLQDNVRQGSRVFVVIEGGGMQAQRAFGDELVVRLRQRAPAWLVDAQDGVHEAREFLAPRAGMFVELRELERLRHDIEARWSWEVAKQTDALLDDEPPPPLVWNDLKKRFGAPSTEKFPDGYFQATDGRALVVNVATTVATGDLAGAENALAEIRRISESLSREPRHAQLKLSYAGDLVTGLAEYGAVKADLVQVGVLGLSLVVLVLFLYFLRLRALVALGLTLAVGLAWTFGATELAIGHLNVATGFLVSIVAGNGINFGIILTARFYEERRRGRDLAQALELASALTWRATLAAALAAAAAYGSLGISEFRAFRHFALIGGAGIMVCWLATYATLPSLLLLVERWRARHEAGSSAETSLRDSSYGGPIAALVERAPRTLTLGGVALAVLGLVSLVPYVKADPMEYDMRRMQNDLGESSEMYRAAKLAGEILGAELESSMVLLADRVDQVPLLEDALQARRAAAAPGLEPFERVHSVFDFVPPQQAEKLPILQQIRARILKARQRGFVSDADFEKLAQFLPPAELAPWSIADLPKAIARPFQDKHGVVGRVALIEPTAGQSDADVKYLMRWADSFREVPLANGEVVHGSGRAVIFADLVKTVLSDIPRTVSFSLAMTLGVVFLTFWRGFEPAPGSSRFAPALLVIAALLVGLGWVALAMTACGVKINFFNFIALPISFGIGVDYAVNYVLRYEQDPERNALAVLRSTGGAIILCSLTTVLGYLALLASVNQAIRSLGLLAVLGEIGCLAAATLVLPGYLLWREQSAARRSSVPAPSAAKSAPV